MPQPVSLPWVLTAALLSALTAVTAGLAILLRAPCLRTGFTGDTQFWSACYADLPTAYRDSKVKAGLAAYLQGGDGAPLTGQPPLTGLVLTAVASLGPDDGSLKTRAAWYFALWSVLLTLLLLAIVWLVASSAARPFSAAHVALSPVVVLAGFISADLLGVALASAGMWAWSRRNPTLAGVLLGLAIGARSYPVLILVAIALLCVRSGRLREMGRVVGYALLTFGALLSALWLLNREAAASSYQSLGVGRGRLRLAVAAAAGSPGTRCPRGRHGARRRRLARRPRGRCGARAVVGPAPDDRRGVARHGRPRARDRQVVHRAEPRSGCCRSSRGAPSSGVTTSSGRAPRRSTSSPCG